MLSRRCPLFFSLLHRLALLPSSLAKPPHPHTHTPMSHSAFLIKALLLPFPLSHAPTKPCKVKFVSWFFTLIPPHDPHHLKLLQNLHTFLCNSYNRHTDRQLSIFADWRSDGQRETSMLTSGFGWTLGALNALQSTVTFLCSGWGMAQWAFQQTHAHTPAHGGKDIMIKVMKVYDLSAEINVIVLMAPRKYSIQTGYYCRAGPVSDEWER